MSEPASRSHDVNQDPWAWVDERDDDSSVDLSHHHVSAVIVTRNGAAWLGDLLDSLVGLDHQPDRVIAVDTGSRDDSVELLRTHPVVSTVIEMPDAPGFGIAVERALAADAEALASDPAQARTDPDRQEWVWTLHDDARVEPASLTELLSAAAADPQVAAVGPALRRPRRAGEAAQLSELGVTIAETGRRELNLEPGEIDQGQHQPAEVLGVSTCGMLVDRQILTEVGFTETVPLFRDGVDFGWRVNLTGRTVKTCPEAKITHRQVGRAGLREDAPWLQGRTPASVDAELGMRVIAGHRGGARRILTTILLVLAGCLRSLGFLLGKAPGRARDEFRAVGGFLLHGSVVRDLRAKVGRLSPDRETSQRADAMVPGWWSSVVRAVEGVAGALVGRYRDYEDRASIDELTGDDFAGPRRVQTQRSRTWIGVLIAAVATLVASRQFFGTGELSGPRLLTPPEGFVATVAEMFTTTGGLSGAPWLSGLGLSSLITLGQPDWLVTWMILGAVPIGLWAARMALRQLIPGNRLRWIVSVAYALLPVLIGIGTRGIWDLAVWVLGLPLAVAAGVRLVTAGDSLPTERWRGAALSVLSLLLLGTITPTAVAAYAVVVVVAGLLYRSGWRTWVGLLVAIGAWAVLVSPWWPTLAQYPGRLVTGTDPVLASLTAQDPWQLLLGQTDVVGQAPLWLNAIAAGGILVLALVGLFLRADRGQVIGLVVMVLGLGLAAALSQLVVIVPAGQVRPAVETWLLLGYAAALVVAGRGWQGLVASLTRRNLGGAHVLTVIGGLIAAVVLALGSGWWLLGGTGTPLERSEDAVPAYLRGAEAQGLATLTIDARAGQPTWNLQDSTSGQLGSTERNAPFGTDVEGRELAESVVLRLLNGVADDQLAADLHQLGVGHVRLLGGDAELQARVENAPGLGSGAALQDATTWPVLDAQPRAGAAPLTVGHIWWGVGLLVGLAVVLVAAAPGVRRLEARDPALYARRVAVSDVMVSEEESA
ncbi:hypothetical protein CGZ92_06300 [Parenemella sanctibonifatiensis]|uniref:Glycosyltransferase family 2 protein n=1 Tax=Parenemella sanctibonifatiensis TaxID=2016505 RepID=A0A255E8H1_9ACTN|nr:hypothetical protein CGZ92_06300 [Parenemella sanctibonifatiensis]